VLPAVAAAGYHAVAPDIAAMDKQMRRRASRLLQLKIVGDIVGLVHALGYEQAVISGHDMELSQRTLRPISTGHVSRSCSPKVLCGACRRCR